ncbi:MAG: hypothetical protein E6182_18820 [Clostridioides difficile]|nr:hypothetical protein [Clostridioides difficile]
MKKVVDLISIVLCIMSMISVWFMESVIELRVGCFIWIIASLILITTKERENQNE